MLIIFIVLFLKRRTVITYEMTYFNSGYNYDKEVSKASYIFVLWTVNKLLPPLYVYTYGIVLFSSHTHYMVNSKLSF